MLSTPKGLLQSSFADGRRLQRNLFCLSIFALVMTLLLPLKVSQATSLQGGFCCPQLSANEGQFDAGGNPSPQFRAMSPSSHLQYLGYNYVGVAPETPQAIWVAKATAPWIHVYPAIGTTINGVGSGYCPFTLDPNSGSTRSATIIFSVSTPTGIVYEVPAVVGCPMVTY